LNRLNTFRLNAEADAQSTPSYQYWPGTSVAITYDKSALWLHTLERYLGWPVMQRILATYYERWKFRHPRPDDFFRIASEVSGKDLAWFFDEVHRSSHTFDYGVQDVVTHSLDGGRHRTTVVVRRFGEATFPVDVVTTFDDGERITERWDGAERRTSYVYEKPARATLVQVDPQRVLLLDVNYTNNTRLARSRSGEASLKWAATWMTWLQDLMLTYAFFI
jgi:aminopeptidase N